MRHIARRHRQEDGAQTADQMLIALVIVGILAGIHGVIETNGVAATADAFAWAGL